MILYQARAHCTPVNAKRRKRSEWTAMEIIIVGIIAFALFLYLLSAVIRPDKF